MVRWTLWDTLAFLLLLSLLLPSLLIMFIPSTFKRPVSSWKALNLRKTLLMASSVRLKPLNCSRLPCVYAQETLTTLMRPSLVLFLVLWLKLVKDFLKVRCRLALLPFLISCLIWLDLVASLPLIKERILVIILLLHFLSLMLGSVLVLMLPLLVWLTPD